MGFARVISGGELGRYTIEIDYGASTRTAILAAMDALLAALVVKIAAVAVRITAADEKELAQQVKVAQAQADYIAESQALPPGSPAPQATQFKYEVLQLTQLRAAHATLRLAESALKFDYANAQRRRAYWDAFNPVETRDAWCVDYTENRAAGSFVATVDVPGESALILLAPGARAWAAGDGILTARELMSPEQAYFNAAILPGWQKDMPTYRWGTITDLDKPAALCSVSLFDAVSSAQRLPVNQTSALAGVPIVYMDCNAEVFEVDDRVVVQFLGQDWEQPVVIGFVDNPKECGLWPCIKADSAVTTTPGYPPGQFGVNYLFKSNGSADATLSFDSLFAASEAGTLSVDIREDSGAWQVLTKNTVASNSSVQIYLLTPVLFTNNISLILYQSQTVLDDGDFVTVFDAFTLNCTETIPSKIVEVRAKSGIYRINVAGLVILDGLRVKTAAGLQLVSSSQPCERLTYVLDNT